MNIMLCKVTEDEKEILYRLLQYSLFEESISDLNEMNENAIFEYKWFEHYFTDQNREAYFIKDEKSGKLLNLGEMRTLIN